MSADPVAVELPQDTKADAVARNVAYVRRHPSLVISTQAALGNEFNWDVFDSLIRAATDEQLAALLRPVRRPR